MAPDAKVVARLPLLAAALLCLIGGVLAGLARLGVEVAELAAAQAGWHGALMISAFFGAVISLERAVALARGWAYLAPLGAGAGGLGLLAGLPLVAVQTLFVIASALLGGASLVVMRRQLALFTAVLGVGAACWLIGNLVWVAAGTLQAAIPWWLAFLVITIAGERLELTRFLPARRAAPPLFMLSAGLVLVGAPAGAWQAEPGLRIFSAGLLALALWLLRYDIARHNSRQQGLTRYIALCLLSGYAWLAAAALIGLGGGLAAGHPWRDAGLHAVALGFVFAMVFGHAPIIFPAIARVRIRYHAAFYVPLLALHLSLLLRVAGGAAAAVALQRAGAIMNALSLVLFVAMMVAGVLGGRATGGR